MIAMIDGDDGDDDQHDDAVHSIEEDRNYR
jgi:hypothetical protein